MTIQPCSYHLLIRIVDSRKPESGLVLPENIKPIQPHGLVISVGSDVGLFEPGTKVMFLPDNGIIVDEAEKLWIIPESCVFAILVGEEAEANGRK